jgi:hypothetical protein
MSFTTLSNGMAMRMMAMCISTGLRVRKETT